MPYRRSLLRACAAAGIAGVAGCLSDAPPESTPDAGSPTDATRTPSPTSGATVAWERSLPGVGSGSPALADDRLYVGSEGGTVTALSRGDGSVRWQFESERPVRGTPTVAGDAVLAVSAGVEQGGHDTLHALDAESGEQRWSFAPDDWWLGVLGTTDGAAFVATSDDAIDSSGQNLYALALADGGKRWSVEVGDNSGGLVAEGTVYVPSTNVVDAVGTDGSRRWTYEGEEYQYRTLAVVGDTVAFVTTPNQGEWRVVGVDAATGDRRWTFDDWRAHTTRAAGDRLFVGGERVARLDPASGDPLWVTDRRAALYDAPVVDGTLYVAGRTAAALAVEDGTPAWTTELDAYIARPAGLAEGRLLVHRSESRDDRDRHVLALDAASGDTAWEFAGDDELTTPAVGTDRAYLTGPHAVLALAV